MTSSIMSALSLSFLVASVAAQQYKITFDLQTLIESCGSTTIGYTVTPFITGTVPIALILSVLSADGTTNNVITQNANLTAGSYDWDPVAVRGGQQYTIAARSDEYAGISGYSDPFVIRIGETAACLTAPTSGPGPVNPIPPISQAPSSGSSSPSVTQTPPATTKSQPPSTVSQPASNSTSPFIPTNQLSSSGLSTGAKAGISIAAVVVVLGALVGLYFLLIARRRTRASRARAVAAVRSQGRSSPTHEWKGLESKDYYAGTATALTASRSSVAGGAGSNTTVPSSMQAVNHGHDALGRSIGSGHPATVSTFSQNDVGDEKVAGYGGYPPHDAPGLAYIPAVKRTSSNGGGPMNRSTSDASSASIPEVRRSKGPTQRKPVPVYNPSSSEVDHNRGESSDSFIDPFNVTPIASDDSHHIFPPLQQHDLHRKGSFPNEKPMEHVLSVDPPVQRVGSPPYASTSKHRSA